MKKLLLLFCLIGLLCGCSSNAVHDSFSAYRNKTAGQLYDASKKDLKGGHYDRAVKQLEALNALYPFGAHAESGMITLVYAYYENDDADEAQATADRYLALYPRGQYADYAYYMKGVIAFKQGLTWMQRKAGVDRAPRDLTHMKHAYLSFSELTRNFPTSAYTADAIARMRYIRNLFAEQEVGIAQFYYDKKAYVAAANRASNVVEHYDRSPWVIPALKLMVQSYRKLGLNAQANHTLKIFEASYPSSRVLKKLMSDR